MAGAEDILIDNWGRRVNYLRIAITDRCNLRCFYCMPEEGINYLPKKELLTYEELLRLAPFNGDALHSVALTWNHKRILQTIQNTYPETRSIAHDFNSTSLRYQIDGFQGSFGIIPAYSRTFCNTCNRLRITSQGTIKTCLYDDGVLDLKESLRNGSSDDLIKNQLRTVVGNRAKDGFEAEKARKILTINESMSSIGG